MIYIKSTIINVFSHIATSGTYYISVRLIHEIRHEETAKWCEAGGCSLWGWAASLHEWGCTSSESIAGTLALQRLPHKGNSVISTGDRWRTPGCFSILVTSKWWRNTDNCNLRPHLRKFLSSSITSYLILERKSHAGNAWWIVPTQSSTNLSFLTNKKKENYMILKKYVSVKFLSWNFSK